jgi:hypothetical protein
MRAYVLSFFLTVAVLLPNTARAQVMQIRTPAPEVTAATAAWQLNGEPIIVGGLVYNPTRETRMFDGQVMTQIDVYERVPIYADTTREPFTVLYVPVTRDLMRAYERPPVSAFAATPGRTAAPIPLGGSTVVALPQEERIVGTTGTIVSSPAPSAAPSRPRRTIDESIPRPRVRNGVWVEYKGARWYSDGASTSYLPERFTQIGEYRGFPVYRDRTGTGDEIWIAVVNGGPIAPYARR